ncbi:MAG: hypothetical protein CMH50_09415 [Myxococcales bacterium]|nr:hypothetical protein [Myxococcales bacterium]
MNPLLPFLLVPILATAPEVEPSSAGEVSAEVEGAEEVEKERLVYAPLVAERSLRQIAERLDGSLVLRFREIAPFELVVPKEAEDLDPSIARLLRFGCRDISCVSVLAETFSVEKVIMGVLRNEGGVMVLDLKIVEHKRGMELRQVSLEGSREAQLVEQLSGAVGRLSDDEAAAAALEAKVAAENARMQPKPVAERVREQVSVGLPTLIAGLKKGWTPQLSFEANDQDWNLGLGIEWDLPSHPFSLVADFGYSPERPCLCEGANFSTHALVFELGVRRYLWRKGALDSLKKPDHSGLFVDLHHRRSRLSWIQAGGVPINRGRSQWGLALGWRHIVHASGLSATVKLSGDAVTANESPAAWGGEIFLWRGGLALGYRL